MEAYTDFAQLYDLFMEETPYEKWCTNICHILKTYQISDGLMAELGCGTGKMTRLLSQKGFDMIGIDSSPEMLNIAKAQEPADSNILYLMQDMREFELYGTVRAIVSVCDSMNYLLEEEDLLTVFSLANNYLDPGGIFLFDMNTSYKYREIFGCNTFAQNLPDASFIWENDYDEESGINQYDVTFFQRQEGGLFRRFSETHVQRGYEAEKVKELLSRAGLQVEEILDMDTMESANEQTERICFVAREQGKR